MIFGKSVTLLPFDEVHLPLVRKWVNQPEVRAGTGTEGPVSEYEHCRWYRNLMDDPAQRAFIIGDGAGEAAKPVGLIGLNDLKPRRDTGEYWIYIGEPAARRRGLATEATCLILDFGFNTLALHRIYLYVIENNLAALNLYRKLGFIQEGIAREQFFWRGRYLDMIQFAMLEDEFREIRHLGESWHCETQSL